MRTPAPRANAEDRAEVIRNSAFHTISGPEPEANLAAIYVSRRYGLALPLSRAVVTLACLGRAFG
jgi:hypothetical protein